MGRGITKRYVYTHTERPKRIPYNTLKTLFCARKDSGHGGDKDGINTMNVLHLFRFIKRFENEYGLYEKIECKWKQEW